MRTYLFDDFGSVWHFVLGMLIVLMILVNAKLVIVTYLVNIAFAVYELREYENPTSTVGDFVEFMFGELFGMLGVLVWLIMR